MMGYFNTLDVRNSYNIAKRVAENIISTYKYMNNMDFLIFRVCRCFGPIQKNKFLTDQRVVFSLFRQAILNESIVLTSRGNQQYSYIFLYDCLKAFLFGTKYLPRNECYNIANPEYTSLRNFAERICKVSKKKLKIEVAKTSEEKYVKISKNILNTDKIRQFGFVCDYSLDDSIRETFLMLGGGDNHSP